MRLAAGLFFAVFMGAAFPALAWANDAKGTLFWSGDLSRDTGFLSSGYKTPALAPLLSGDVVLMGSVGGGFYRSKPAGDVRKSGRVAQASLLLGWNGRVGEVTHLGFYGGALIDGRHVSPRDALKGRVESSAALKLQADVWSKPAQRWLFAGSAAYVPQRHDVWAQAHVGYSAPILAGYIGPEITFAGNNDTRDAHLRVRWSEVDFAGARWHLSVGGVRHKGGRFGPSAAVGGYRSF
jgi:Cellulose biosynthesis protein BcsS